MKNNTFLTPAATVVATLVCVIMLGVADWASGYELQFFVFYFVPIAIAAWTAGQTLSYVVAALSMLVWFVADKISGYSYPHTAYLVWNTLIRTISFLIIGYAVARIRLLLTEEQKISNDLQKALGQVNILSGLLPICTDCKKIRNDEGYWQQIEEYIAKHSEAQFTHGLCQECTDKLLNEAGFPSIAIEQPVGGDSSPPPARTRVPERLSRSGRHHRQSHA